MILVVEYLYHDRSIFVLYFSTHKDIMYLSNKANRMLSGMFYLSWIGDLPVNWINLSLFCGCTCIPLSLGFSPSPRSSRIVSILSSVFPGLYTRHSLSFLRHSRQSG